MWGKPGSSEQVDRRVGVSRRWYAAAWWVLVIWNACAVINIWSRTQQWNFALPVAPDFKNTASPYGIAAIGGIGLAVVYWLTLAGLLYYARQWGRDARHWFKRIPAFTRELEVFASGQLVTPLYTVALVVAVVLPLGGQLHFVDKFLSGTSRHLDGSLYANDWQSHLFPWISFEIACRDFIYDGMGSFAYCEFYEPWVMVICALISFALAVIAARAVFSRPRRSRG